MLDLKNIFWKMQGVAGFARKRDAQAFAKKHGWESGCVREAYNRFCIFWVVAKPSVSQIENDWVFLTNNGGKVSLIAKDEPESA